jgi:hypothetical protein
VKIIDMDSLATASTYSVQVRSSDNGTNTFFLNRAWAGAGADTWEAGLSVVTATEIAQ